MGEEFGVPREWAPLKPDSIKAAVSAAHLTYDAGPDNNKHF